ncbi:hypothetical protein [Sphingopyxis sp. PET50]|uniref:hypothetical protein n=1 Tax=Sphingopyxis sp. PET50 TaxID=2976533 RepID=UPI0021B02A2C|nr:hypothetical protein [Sphingopyxis sp. PET50]
MMNAPVGGALHRYRIPAISTLALAMALALPLQADAAGTRAGSTISNTASASFDTGGGTQTIDSNQVDLRVDELLDVTVDSSDPADVPTTPGATAQLLTFSVTNSGNGEESFALSTIANGGGDDYDPAVTQIYIDNGDGVFDANTDTLYTPGANDPTLDPDESVTIFVLSTTPGTVADGNRGTVSLVAASKTGTGTPGTSFAQPGRRRRRCRRRIDGRRRPGPGRLYRLGRHGISRQIGGHRRPLRRQRAGAGGDDHLYDRRDGGRAAGR